MSPFLIFHLFKYIYTIQRGLKLDQGPGTTCFKAVLATLDLGTDQNSTLYEFIDFYALQPPHPSTPTIFHP